MRVRERQPRQESPEVPACGGSGHEGSRIGSKKRGKKAWTRSTVVSVNWVGPTTISHQTPSPPVAPPPPRFQLPLQSLRNSVSPLHPSLSAALHPPIVVSPPSQLRGAAAKRADIVARPYLVAAADRSCARDGSITLARRLLSYSRAVSLSAASSFLTETAHRSPTHGGLRPLLARRRGHTNPRRGISSLMPGDNTIGRVRGRYRRPR